MADDTQGGEVQATTAKAFAAKATDLQALRDAVVDAASVIGGLWLSYLLVFLYLAVAAGGVTHRDLFFENRVKLPFLNVDLPLVGFFVLGPLLFVIVHAYTLLHFALLAGKVGAFDTALQQQIADEGIRAGVRRQLPSNIFVQFLAGLREVRTGAFGFMLRLIAWASLVVGPILLLVLFQLQFLPYQTDWIWWQRSMIVADLVLLWVFWPMVAQGTTSLRWREFRRGRLAGGLVASLLIGLMVVTVATFPGEWLDDHLPSLRIVPISWAPIRWASLHELFIAGAVDEVEQRPRSLWSNRLVLPGIDVIDRAKFDSEAKISGLAETISLRGRRLNGAVLVGSHLRKADFTGAQLESAVLAAADLREAKFGCALTGSEVQGSELQCTNLRGAILVEAQLQGEDLSNAQLQGANLDRAHLQGATLTSAQLQGAALAFAQLQGADLTRAEFQGAQLAGAQLQGAMLGGAHLDGAWPDYAQLQGAWLDGTQLQGASLDHVQLQGALLAHVFGWRADVRHVNGEGARVVSPETEPKYRSSNCPQPCDWSPGSFAALKQLIERQVPKGGRRDDALKRIAALDPATLLPEEEALATAWTDLARSSLSLDEYEKGLAKWLRETGCDANGAPYVIRRLLGTLDARFTSGSPQPAALANAFLDGAHCPGARGLSDEEKFRLQMLRDQAAPAPALTMPKRSTQTARDGLQRTSRPPVRPLGHLSRPDQTKRPER
jgi:uncharacterized protein YjbI with pentapeptide repeats